MATENKPIDRAIAKKQLERINAVLKCPQLLIGGLAVQQYYPARMSKDIDLVCDFATAHLLLETLYPSRDWKIVDKQNDEYRPSFQITHKVDDLGTIIFGPKITEREPYKHLDWNRLMSGASPFNGSAGSLENILVPSAHALAYTKFISFISRRAPEEKIRNDLKDIVDLSNCEDFCVSLFFDFLRMSKALEELTADFRAKIGAYQDLLKDSCLCGLAELFISNDQLSKLPAPEVLAHISEQERLEPSERELFSVTTAEEFLNAIGPNRVIEIHASTINLGEVNDRYMEYVRWDPEYDGRTITLRNLEGIEIRGRGIASTRIVVSPKYTYVLGFDGCRGVKISDITLGHEPQGACTGGVLGFSRTCDVMLERCTLFGCGTEGITMQAVDGFTMTDSEVFDCTYGILTVKSSRRLLFSRSAFRNNREFHGVSVHDSEDILFMDCQFRGNVAKEHLFEIISSSDIRVVRGIISDNQCYGLGNIETDGVDLQPRFEPPDGARFGNFA